MKLNCNHYGFGTATTYPIDKKHYNQAMKDSLGGDGWYRDYVLVVYCDRCGALLEVDHRKAAIDERLLWRLTGGKHRPYWKSLPFLP